MTNKDLKGFTAFQMYRSLLLHFNKSSDYNAVSYYFKTNVKTETFVKSGFRWQYAKLENDHKSSSSLLFTFLRVFETFGYKPFSEKALFNRLFNSRKELTEIAFYQKFKKELIDMKAKCGLESPTLQQTIDADDEGLYPKIYNMQMKGDISLTTLYIVDAFRTPSTRGILNKERSKDIINWTSVIDEGELVKPLLLLALNNDVVDDIFRDVFPELNES